MNTKRPRGKRGLRSAVTSGVMALLGASVLSVGFAGLVGTAAHASTWTPDPSTRYVQVCKNTVTGNLAVTGSFSFTVSGHEGVVTVPVNDCSDPIPVTASTVTIHEFVDPAYSVTAITPEAGGHYVVAGTTNLLQHAVAGNPAQSVQVTTSPGTTSTVTYTDAIDLGYVEVCKYASPTSGLSGTFNFNVTGAEGWLNGGPASTSPPNPPISLTIPVNGSACSNPIPMPASSLLVNGVPQGVADDTPVPVTVTEAGTNLYVTSLSASITNDSDAALESANLVTGQAALAVEASSNTSNDTIVNYTDDVVSFKVCKDWDSSNGSETAALVHGTSTAFPFSYTVSGVTGPDAALAANSVTAGNCTADSTYRAGTEITINEGPTAGSKLEAISLQDALSGSLLSAPTNGVIETAPTTAQLLAGQISVILGTPVTAPTTTPSNEVAVHFTDTAADPGTLKICKTVGTGATAPVPPASGYYSFTYSGSAYATVASAPGVTPVVTVGEPLAIVTGTVNVEPGQCAIATEAPVNSTTGVGTPVPFLFDTNITVTEAGNPSDVANGVTTNLSNVLETLGGVEGQATPQPVLTNILLATSNDMPSSAEVTASEDNETIVTFNNIDPPAGTNPVGSTPVVTSGGVTVATPSSSSSVSTSSNINTILSGIISNTNVKKLTAKQRAAELKAAEKSLSKVNSSITKDLKAEKTAHGKALKALQKKVAALRSEVRTLNKEIKVLK